MSWPFAGSHGFFWKAPIEKADGVRAAALLVRETVWMCKKKDAPLEREGRKQEGFHGNNSSRICRRLREGRGGGGTGLRGGRWSAPSHPSHRLIPSAQLALGLWAGGSRRDVALSISATVSAGSGEAGPRRVGNMPASQPPPSHAAWGPEWAETGSFSYSLGSARHLRNGNTWPGKQKKTSTCGKKANRANGRGL